jgi:hypothetical protein
LGCREAVFFCRKLGSVDKVSGKKHRNPFMEKDPRKETGALKVDSAAFF